MVGCLVPKPAIFHLLSAAIIKHQKETHLIFFPDTHMGENQTRIKLHCVHLIRLRNLVRFILPTQCTTTTITSPRRQSVDNRWQTCLPAFLLPWHCKPPTIFPFFLSLINSYRAGSVKTGRLCAPYSLPNLYNSVSFAFTLTVLALMMNVLSLFSHQPAPCACHT